jgi:hypothetical protein
MKAHDRMMIDNQAMCDIHKLFDGHPVNSDTLKIIMDIVLSTGRTIEEPESLDEKPLVPDNFYDWIVESKV